MRAAPIGARLSTAIRREMWEKWVLLAALGAITGLMRATIGEVEACPGGAGFAAAAFNEVVAIARAVGVAPSESFLGYARSMLTEPGSPLTSSIARDLQRGRPVESEAIVGDLLRRGAEAGLDAPLLSAAYVHLTAHMNRLGMSR